MRWNDHILNVVDTPGHSDFVGEVRLAVSMTEAAILVVDVRQEVNEKAKLFLIEAVQRNLDVVVLLNRVDRSDASASALKEISEAFQEKVWSLLVDSLPRDDLYDEKKYGNLPVCHSLDELLKFIIEHVPAPSGRVHEPFQMMVSMISQGDKWGHYLIGKITDGVVACKENVKVLGNNAVGVGKVLQIRKPTGIDTIQVDEGYVGEIVFVALGGKMNVKHGHTIANMQVTEPLPPLVFEEPNYYMLFSANISPYARRDDKNVHTGKLYDFLVAESERNPALKVIREGEVMEVRCKGSRHMAVLLEMVRREGFEVSVYRKKSKGENAPTRNNVMVCVATGKASKAPLMSLQKQGTLFVSPGEEVYEFMIVGKHSNHGDLKVNPIQNELPEPKRPSKSKNVKLIPPHKLSIEEAISEYVSYDVMCEVTPHCIRLRKMDLG